MNFHKWLNRLFLGPQGVASGPPLEVENGPLRRGDHTMTQAEDLEHRRFEEKAMAEQQRKERDQ